MLLLAELFPCIARAYDQNAFESGNESLRDLRVSHPSFFERYFQLTVPDTALRESDLAHLMSLSSNPMAFTEKLREIGSGSSSPR